MTEYIELDKDKILFSHAGITNNWANMIKKRLELELLRAISNQHNNTSTPILTK